MIDWKKKERLEHMNASQIEELLQKELLTVDEVSAIWDVVPATVVKYIQCGWISGYKIGPGKRSPWRIRSSSVKSRMSGASSDGNGVTAMENVI